MLADFLHNHIISENDSFVRLSLIFTILILAFVFLHWIEPPVQRRIEIVIKNFSVFLPISKTCSILPRYLKVFCTCLDLLQIRKIHFYSYFPENEIKDIFFLYWVRFLTPLFSSYFKINWLICEHVFDFAIFG